MSISPQASGIDEAKMNEFLGKVVTDFGAALSTVLAYIGEKLGLYNALAESGPSTPKELADRTGTAERYVREWLINQAAGGYIEYDSKAGRYYLSPEQRVALTDPMSPFYVGGGFYSIKALARAEPRISEAFRTGGGMLWGDHDPDLFVGTEKFFRPGYTAHLVNSWIPAIDGIEEKLKAGATVADIGCGHGASTIIMAKAYPNSRFYAFDNHEASISHAREAARAEGVDGISFEVADATSFPKKDGGYDFITFFDCLHDMGNPVGAIKQVSSTLKPDGRVMIVEPMAGDRVEENFNPVGRTFSAASTLCCTANSLALGGPALGAVATEEQLRETVNKGGLKHFRRATETPFNRIFEAGL
jgi:2-polyprenyl-3-methyl-5-hydroxy-6-metoxy-1,4-benzoquinol methylase